MPLWTVSHHPGGPDATSVLQKRGGDSEAEPAGSGSETGGGAAASLRARDAPLQEGAPHCRAEEVSGGCKMSSEVSTKVMVIKKKLDGSVL